MCYNTNRLEGIDMNLLISPYIYEIGKFQLRWYSVLIFVVIILSIIYCKVESRKFNIPWDFFFNLLFWTIIVGFIGARIYYVLFNFSDYSNDLVSILKIWEVIGCRVKLV